MSIALAAFILSLVIYLLGILVAKTLTPNVGVLDAWVKKMRRQNVSVGIQVMAMSYQRLAFWIGVGNLTFGLLLVVSGSLLGIPALVLLFRSTLMAWGILDSHLFDTLKRTRSYFGFLITFIAVAEAVLFIFWSSIGVTIGLSAIAHLIGQGGTVAQLRPFLPFLPWAVMAMVLAHVVFALLEAHVMATLKPEFIRSFFQRSEETADCQQPAPAEKESVA
jgi:hypothetical protein